MNFNDAFDLYFSVGYVVSLAGGYLIGSVSFAVIVSRMMGLQDPRQFGSGNPGATNVLRSGNKKAALFTLIGDLAKGTVAVLIAAWCTRQGWLREGAAAVAGLGAFIGHLYPVFLRFKGGKGVATALGVLLGLQPLLALACAATWLIVAVFTRYSSLAAIVAAVFTPFYYVFGSRIAWPMVPTTAMVILLISVLLLLRHQQNITRLLAGTETRIGQKKPKN